MLDDPKQRRTIFAKAAPPQFEMRFNPMFGGILVYVFDKPAEWLSDAGLALKMPGTERDALLAIQGAKPLPICSPISL
ncbi:MAG: hypothetical protein JWM91_4866 [Rhodospirillales bacterium]|nr:hypothetical protein [Rhodospirillales bacterium]